MEQADRVSAIEKVMKELEKFDLSKADRLASSSFVAHTTLNIQTIANTWNNILKSTNASTLMSDVELHEFATKTLALAKEMYGLQLWFVKMFDEAYNRTNPPGETGKTDQNIGLAYPEKYNLTV